MSENEKGKNTIMKMLLSTAPVVSTPPHVTAVSTAFIKAKHSSPKADKAEERGEEFRLRLKRYFHKLSKQGEGNDVYELIIEDHCYSKPWNSRPDRSFMNPVKTLFLPKNPMVHASTPMVGEPSGSEDVIDVEGDDPQIVPPFDVAESDLLANECERHVDSVRADICTDDWEDRVNRTGWTPAQSRLFSRVVRVLHADRLNRLALSPVPDCKSKINRPTLRRLAVDCAARRVRQALASASWDVKLVGWLHAILMEYLSGPYLASYLDILQTLRAKIPSLIDKMISSVKTGHTNSEALELLLKRPWDPVSMQLNRSLPQTKLPGNPVLVVVPSGPMKRQSPDKVSKRKQAWMQHFSALTKVVTVPPPPTRNEKGEKLTFSQYTTLMASTTRAKVREIRSANISSPIFLIGWGQGALLACQVSLVEPVAAVICLGFPMHTVEGNRGDPDDSILDLHCPVYFVIGQNAATVSSDDVEDLRERMHVETNLLVIGGADDMLRVPRAKMKLDGLTQSIVDRCIMDEVADFIGGILTRPPASTVHQSPPSTMVRSLTPVIPSSVALVEVNSSGSNRRGGGISGPRERRKRMALPLASESGEDGSSLPLSAPGVKRPRLSNNAGSIQRRRPRSQSSQKMMLASMNFQSKDKWSGTQFISSRQALSQNPQAGITVNIGSLASLAPLGPLKLSQSDCASDASGSADGASDETAGKGLTGSMGAVRTGTLSGATHSTTLTTLSSLLQQHSSNGLPKTVRVSAAPPTSVSPGVASSSNIILSPSTQIKVMGNADDRGQVSPTTRIISGRTVDLSKLALLTGGSGNGGTKGIVMLTDSVRGGSGGGPMLVPLSTAAGVSPNSPIAILPLASSREVGGGGVTMTSHHGRRTLAVVPRITVSSLKMPVQAPQESLSTPVATASDDNQSFNPESILELPIIFAKEGEDPTAVAGGVPDGGDPATEAKTPTSMLSSGEEPQLAKDESSMEGQEMGEGPMEMGGGMGLMRVVPSSDTGEESEEDGTIRVLMSGQSPLCASPRGRRGRRTFSPAAIGGTRTRRIRTPKQFTM
ncbi:KAT8 regulatory NSL complex subunit 3 isoform X2 [Ischnura elegans]|uniref:KAT8 regulatory NSL complex subunit 3 isoform X2 n=1 Tax=Ischnura elegans TaxID=197161 RepID=UPI001ED8B6EC|nr:KAT8 regulatory NSL complex subunit 3 isoform X2 [Ischnura elegans]